MKSINPYNGETIAHFSKHTDQEVGKILFQSQEQFLHWKNTSFNHRARLIRDLGQLLQTTKRVHAEMITREMGKPISQSIAEIEKCIWLCKYYADHAELQLAPEYIETEADRSYVNHEPLGVILAVMPWNYPYWQVFRFAIPALMAGNVAVLKHASNVLGCAELIQQVMGDAGIPKGCFSVLRLPGNEVAKVIEHPIIKAVTLTGSGPAGSSVAETAGRYLKKSVLELGGNNALIVLNDCDIEKTVETCIQARFQNTGQSCIAGKRLLVDEGILKEFKIKFLEGVRSLQSGNPMNENTFVGTLAREDLAETIENQVKKSIEMGAILELGGKRYDAYFEPTVLSGVTPDMPIFNEETFGPAIGITTFSTIEEAISLSNDSKFGLGVSIFSENIKQVERFIPQFEEGAVFINELVKSDPRLPFGGIKESGYGRELSAHGIKEFVNVKTVFIKK